MKRLLPLALVALGCIDPLSDDTVALGKLQYQSPADVPRASDEIMAQIDANDGVERLIARRSAFWKGQRVWYWDFGPAPARTLPLYAIVRLAADGTPTILTEHPYIIDSIPGDAGYTPFWTVYFVPVTAAWNDDAIASVAELQLAQDLGLVGQPFEAGVLSNCPVVHPDVRLVTKDVAEVPPADAFYRGVTVPLYGMGFFDPAADGTAPISDVVQLRRLGGEPVDEGARGVDITGDADTNDSNNIFRIGPGKTPLWRLVRAAVAEDRSLVDDAQSEVTTTVSDFATLFAAADWPTLSPLSGEVLALEATEHLINCPLEVLP